MSALEWSRRPPTNSSRNASRALPVMELDLSSLIYVQLHINEFMLSWY